MKCPLCQNESEGSMAIIADFSSVSEIHSAFEKLRLRLRNREAELRKLEKEAEEPEENDEEEEVVEDDARIEEQSVQIMMDQVNVTRNQAIKALRSNSYDIVNAILVSAFQLHFQLH